MRCDAVLRFRYGLAGLTGLLLRQDFMESVEMLKKISGMESMFSSLSLHELTACVYYKLAIERGLRGCNPDGEHQLHTPSATPLHGQSACGGEVPVELSGGGAAGHAEQKCRDAHDRDVDLAIRCAFHTFMVRSKCIARASSDSLLRPAVADILHSHFTLCTKKQL